MDSSRPASNSERAAARPAAAAPAHGAGGRARGGPAGGPGGGPGGEPRPRLAPDESGASEVLGFILAFGILSMVLTLALIGFNIAAERTQDRVVELRAESVAQRVAGVVVDVALMAETAGGDLEGAYRLLELPDSLEGHAYTVELGEDTVTVRTQGQAYVEPLLGAGAPAAFDVCPDAVGDGAALPGGPLVVRYAAMPAPCGPADPGQTHSIYLEIP